MTRPQRGEAFSVRLYQYARPIDILGLLADGMRLKVNDNVIEQIRRIAGKYEAPDTAAALAWLSRQTLIGPVHGSPEEFRRMVLSAGGSGSLASGFSVHGPTLSADVAVRADGVEVVKVTSRRVGDPSYQAFLAEGDIEFCDDTSAYRDRDRIQTGLALAARKNGYLAMWEQYQEIESEFVRERVQQFGAVRYREAVQQGDGSVEFWLNLDRVSAPTLSVLYGALAGGEQVELEAAAEVPASVTNRDLAGGDWTSAAAKGTRVPSWIGEVAEFVEEEGLLRLDPSMPGQGVPAPGGWLYLAHRGDQSRLKRRDKALSEVRDGKVLLSALPTVLEGTPWHQPVGKRVQPMSRAVRECFSAEPTSSQVAAIDVALNTPDIAVIQGPPGTGKTQVIAAIVARLSELTDGDVAASVLLTSFQHAAVDHLVTRARPLGLPPVKIDSRGRDSRMETDLWRIGTARAVEAKVRTSAGGRRLEARRDVTSLVAGYRAAPVAVQYLATFLDQVVVAADGLLPDILLRKLDDARQAAEANRRKMSLATDDEARSLLLPYARSLRVTTTGFADDGPARAADLLDALRYEGADLVADIEYGRLLESAASAPLDPPAVLLHELGNLREALLDALTGTVRAPETPVADPSLLALFDDIIIELDNTVAASPDGVTAVLLDYLDDLRGSPESVDRTLRAYTMSLASTCQQAASKAVAEATSDQAGLFDTVIVDEAARANPLDLMIPMARARRRIILVGDHKQLPHMLDPAVERELTRLEEQGRDRLAESLFKRFADMWERGASDGQRRFVRLDAQYRMHPVLGSFVSDVFYEGQLRSGRPASDFVHGITQYGEVPAAWLSVPRGSGGEERRGMSLARSAEARVIADEIAVLIDEHPGLTFGVITFYAQQVQRIWEQLGRHNLAEREGGMWTPVARLRVGPDGVPLDRLRVGSVDAFQGMEFDVVYLSTVRSSVPSGQPDRRRYGHLMSPNRQCVSMSRQRRLLVAVGDEAMFTADASAGVLPITRFHELCESDGVVIRP